MELQDIKRYVLLSDGSIEPSHSGEGRRFTDLRPFVRDNKGVIWLQRAVADGFNVKDRIDKVIATDDSFESLEKEKERYYE